MPKRICRKVGCNNLIDKSEIYCIKHKKNEKIERQIYYKNYDEQRKDTKEYKFYKTKEWVRVREYILREHKGIDLYEYYVNSKIVFANTVHHIEELEINWDLRLEESNLIPVSEATHAMIHSAYKQGKEECENMKKLLKSLAMKYAPL